MAELSIVYHVAKSRYTLSVPMSGKFVRCVGELSLQSISVHMCEESRREQVDGRTPY